MTGRSDDVRQALVAARISQNEFLDMLDQLAAFDDVPDWARIHRDRTIPMPDDYHADIREELNRWGALALLSKWVWLGQDDGGDEFPSDRIAKRTIEVT
jgi:hypothetical protein